MKMPLHRTALFLAALAGLAQAEATNDLVFVQQGTLPIVLSSPHGGTNLVAGVAPRTGGQARQFVSARDSGTAELTLDLAATLEKELGGRPFVVLARFDRKYVDANRPAVDAFEAEEARPVYEAYHRALSNAVASVQARWGRGLLVDIHGQSARTGSIFRGTANGLTVMALTNRFGADAWRGPKSLFGELAARGLDVIPAVASTNREDTRYGGGFIVRTYGSQHPGGIDAVQAEFGAALRARKNRPATATKAAAALAAFARSYLPRDETSSPPGK